MGKGLEQTLLQGRHTEGPETYEKMLNITSHQRDANQNHNEVPSHMSQSGQHKQINKQMLERMQRKGNPSTVLVGMQTGVATVENSMEFPQKTKNGTAFLKKFLLLFNYSSLPFLPIPPPHPSRIHLPPPRFCL